MKQFLQVANDIGAKSYVITWYGDKKEVFPAQRLHVRQSPMGSDGGLKY